MASGKALATVSGPMNDAEKAAFSPDGRQVLTIRQTTARLWDATSGKVITELPELPGDKSDITAVAFSPDGGLVLTSSSGWRGAIPTRTFENEVRLWEVTSGNAIAVLSVSDRPETIRPTPPEAVWVDAIAISPDGRQVLTGFSDNTAQLWEVASGKPIALSGHEDSIIAVTFSPDGRTGPDRLPRQDGAVVGDDIRQCYRHPKAYGTGL
jgi:WD40 repeat protein